MRSSGLARRRAKMGCAAALLAASLAACTAPASTVTVSGKTLAIYASAPSTQQPALSSDVVDAEQLALQQAGAQVGGFTVRFVTLHGKPSDNARTAIQDKTAIAYLGEIAPGSSADSIGITNALDLLQVTPTDTAIALTQSTPAVPGAPDEYYQSLKSYGRTFARVVPNASLEAKAQAQEMQALQVSRLYVASDGSEYGAAVALAVKQDAAGAGISVTEGPAVASKFSASGADALFIGSGSDTVAASLVRTVAASNPATKMFAPSALDTAGFAAHVTPARATLYVSSPGFTPRYLPPSGRTFVSDFAAAYHHPPAAQAILGYEAMSAVLAVLREAASAANQRATVVHDFFSIKNRSSVVGTYSIDSNGDTSIAPFVFSRYAGGSLVPFKFIQVQG
jgi:branched-chain amino acid transport system substrate-binding protein